MRISPNLVFAVLWQCCDLQLDKWKTKTEKNKEGKTELKDVCEEKVNMKEVKLKKYLGTIIADNMKNDANIVEKSNKGIGSVNKIMNIVTERPFGKHLYRAVALLREGLLLGTMLNNAETWTNLTEKQIKKLESVDIMLQRRLVSNKDNPSKAFMALELGFVPIKFVIMGKRLAFLHYILKQPSDSLVRQVYEEMKIDSKKGDFCNQVNRDMELLEIKTTEIEIKEKSKMVWKKHVKQKTKEAALKELIQENENKRTKDMTYEELELQNYLKLNKNKELSKVIFAVRARTFDIKTWRQWKYADNLCVGCEKAEESMNHFMQCVSLGNEVKEHDWENIFGSDTQEQYEIAKVIELRRKKRAEILKTHDSGHHGGSNAPGSP